MSDTEEIRKRHERHQEDIDWANEVGNGHLHFDLDDSVLMHQDRGVLLNRIAELEHQLAGCTCPTVAQLRRQGGG